jgi:hypothetical protein
VGLRVIRIKKCVISRIFEAPAAKAAWEFTGYIFAINRKPAGSGLDHALRGYGVGSRGNDFSGQLLDLRYKPDAYAAAHSVNNDNRSLHIFTTSYNE